MSSAVTSGYTLQVPLSSQCGKVPAALFTCRLENLNMQEDV